MVTGQSTAKKILPIAAFAFLTVGSTGIALADQQTTGAAPSAPVEPAAAPAASQAAPPPTAQPPPAPTPSTPASTPPPPMAPGSIPRVHHAAVYSAQPSEPVNIRAAFSRPELIRKAVAVVQAPSRNEQLIEFRRGERDEYVAVIPGEWVKAPGVAYAIEFELMNGSRVAAFASRAAMHPVTVIEDTTDTRERALLARLGGRRSIVTAGGEFVGFGTTVGDRAIPCGEGQTDCSPGQEIVPQVDEQYYRIEANYTYRPLRTVSEFGFRLGVLRGRSLKPLQTYNADLYDVGLNFGAARVRFRVFDAWHVEGEFLTSVTEEGFSAGLGASTLIGDPYGTKLVLGLETLGLGGAPFGSRFYTRMDIVGAGDRVMISPIVEVTDMPNADAFGVRLLGELAIRISGGFSVQLRGGYQARRSTSGGPGFGGALAYSF